MRTAPPVIWSLGLPKLCMTLIGASWAISLAGGLAVTWGDEIRAAVVMSVHSVSAYLLLNWWRGHSNGLLWWNGQSWAWIPMKAVTGPGGRIASAVADTAVIEAGRLEVCLDLQSAVLVQWRSSATTRGAWWWITDQSDPVRWAALRRALNCSVRSSALTEATGHMPSQ